MASKGYRSVADDDPEDDAVSFEAAGRRQNNHSRWITRLGFVLLLGLSNAMTAIYSRSGQAPCVPETTPEQLSSPFLRRVSAPFRTTQVDATTMANSSTPNHLYRMHPNKEVDEAWDRISDIPYFAITAEEVLELGKDPALAITTPRSWGLPEGSYLSTPDVFHLVHCLNALRKGLVFNYERYTGRTYGLEPPVTYEKHLEHCTDMLLQNLMCHADFEAITLVWHEDQPQPYPDFALNRQCRDFHKLLEWAEVNKIPDMDAKWKAFEKPANATQLPPVPGWQEYAHSRITGMKNGVYTGPLSGLPPQCSSSQTAAEEST